MEDKVNKSLATQIEKYGGIEGYKAEMSRRRKLVKKPYHYFAEVSKEELKGLASKGGFTTAGRDKAGGEQAEESR